MAPEDRVFDEVDFVIWTVVSGTVGKLSFALGANYRKGTSDNITLRNLLTEPNSTSISVKTIGLTYSINHKFRAPTAEWYRMGPPGSTCARSSLVGRLQNVSTTLVDS